jgi:hypothetical protein
MNLTLEIGNLTSDATALSCHISVRIREVPMLFVLVGVSKYAPWAL